jgi:putative tryptophan/tyrosine transport system substrate-binding protein
MLAGPPSNTPARSHPMRRRELLLMVTAMMAASRSLLAQQKAMPVIGYLGIGSPEIGRTLQLEPFRLGLKETGYVEGQM